MNIRGLIKEIRNGKENVFCNNRRISFYNGRFWSSTIATEKSYTESGIYNFLRTHKNNIEIC